MNMAPWKVDQRVWSLVFGILLPLSVLPTTAGAEPPPKPSTEAPPAAVSPVDRALHRRVLGEFGPYKTPAEAKATLE